MKILKIVLIYSEPNIAISISELIKTKKFLMIKMRLSDQHQSFLFLII